MTNSLTKTAKKALTGVVTATTILWSVGVAGLPLVAKAAVPTAPALIKGSLASVYYLNTDGKRYVFPNETTFFTWYNDFAGVQTVTDAELASVPIGGNATFRAGSWLGKITTDPKTYWVSEAGTLHHVQSEADAKALAGADWAKQVRDIPDAFFVNYKVGAPLDSATLLAEGMLFKTAAGGDTFLYDGGKARKVTSTGSTANGFQDKFVRVRSDAAATAAVAAPGAEVADNSYWLGNAPSGGATTGGTQPSGPAGSLTVSAASDTPASVTLADGTSFNSVLKLSLKSSGGKVKISGLKVTRIGITPDSAVSGVSVHDSTGKRHGNIITFADNKALFSFAAGDELVVDGDTTAWVKFNLAAGANAGTVGASISAATEITSDASSVSGSFPVNGSTFTITDGANSVGTLTLDAVLLHNNGNDDVTAVNIQIGDKAKELAKFRLAAGANEDLEVVGVALRNSGNALDADWGNATLVAPDGTVLATVEKSSSQNVDFDLTAKPYKILKGQNRDLTVRIDVPQGSRGSSRTVRLVVQNDYDLRVKGLATGAMILPTAAGTVDTAFPIGDRQGANPNINRLTIQAGTLTLTRSSATPSGNIASGGQGVTLATWDLLPTGEDMEVRQIEYLITRSAATNLSGTFRIEINGTTVYSVSGASAVYGTPTTVTTNTFYVLKAGQKSTAKALADIDSSAASGLTYSVRLDATSVRRIQTDDILDPGVATSTGNTLTVQAASLTVARNSAMTSTTVVGGQLAAKVGSFTLTAGSSEAVIISSLSVALTNITGVNNMVVKSGETQLGTSVASPAASNSVSFSHEIAAGSTATFDVYLDAQSTVTTTEIVTLTVNTATGKVSGTSVSATGSPATGQTITFGANGGLTLALDTTSTPSTHIVHSSQVDETLAAVRLSADNFEDVRLSQLQFAITNGTNNYTNFKLFEGTTQIYPPANGTPAQLVKNLVDFTGLTYVVPKSTSKVLVVKASSTMTGTMNIGANTHVALSYVEATGSASGAQIKPGTTLTTTWTAVSATVVGAALTVGNSDGFNIGDAVFIQSTGGSGGGSLGVVTAVGSGTSLSVGANVAVAFDTAGSVSKIASGATTAATVGTLAVGGTAATVTSTVGFEIGDVVLAYNATDGAIIGRVSAIGSGTSLTIMAHTAGSAATTRVTKLGLTTLNTTWTATNSAAAPTALTVGSSSGFNIGDLVYLHDTTTGGTLGLVTAIGSSTAMTIGVTTARNLTSATTGTIGRVGSSLASLVSTAATAGNAALALTATTVTSTTGFGAGDVVATIAAAGGMQLGRVGAITNATALTIGAEAASANARTRVTRLAGAAASARLMVAHNVEPVVSLQSTSPTGSQVGAAGQVVARFAIKADGDRDMTWTALRVVEGGSNNPQVNVDKNFELKRGFVTLAKVQDGTVAATLNDATAGSFNWTGTTIDVCNAAAGVVAANDVAVTGTNTYQKINKIGTKFTVLDSSDASRSQIITVTNVVGDDTLDATCDTSDQLVVDGAPTGQAADVAITIEPFDRYFTSAATATGDTAMQPQVVTAGGTDLLDLLADTDRVRTGAGAGTSVSFNVAVPGVAGLGSTAQPGGLTWSYTDAAATASGSLTVSDSYPVNSATLVY